MAHETPSGQDLALALAGAGTSVGRRLDTALASARGISFADYRVLGALADAPEGGLSRVDLARSVGLTPSGATRALRPLEKLGMVTTKKSLRDARLALAELTRAGREVVANGSDVVDDAMADIVRRGGLDDDGRRALANLLERLTA